MTLSQHVLYGLFVCAQDPKILSRNFQILPLYTLHTDDICLGFTCMFIYKFTLFRFCLIVCSLLLLSILGIIGLPVCVRACSPSISPAFLLVCGCVCVRMCMVFRRNSIFFQPWFLRLRVFNT